MAKPNSSPGISCVSMSWMLVASAILMSWSVISLVTTGASFNALGVCDPVTTTSSRSTVSRTAMGGVCADTPIASIDNAMLAMMDCENLLVRKVFTAYFLVPVKLVTMANGMLPYFSEKVTTTFFSLKSTTISLTV